MCPKSAGMKTSVSRALLLGAFLFSTTLGAWAKPASVTVEGKVHKATTFTLDSARAKWPDQVKPITFQLKDREGKGYALPLTLALEASQPDIPAKEKNARLRFVWLAEGGDGYLVAISVGELAEDIGAAPAFLVWSEDGEELRLLLPDDKKPSRSVTTLTRLRLLDLK